MTYKNNIRHSFEVRDSRIKFSRSFVTSCETKWMTLLETLILPMKLINYLKKMMIYLGQMTFCSTKKLSKVQQQSKKIQGLFAFVSPLNKLYVIKHLYHGYPCYITFISHKNDVIIIVKLHRATRLRLVALYKDLTMIMTSFL